MHYTLWIVIIRGHNVITPWTQDTHFIHSVRMLMVSVSLFSANCQHQQNSLKWVKRINKKSVNSENTVTKVASEREREGTPLAYFIISWDIQEVTMHMHDTS